MAKKLDKMIAKCFIEGILYYKDVIFGKKIRWRMLWK